MKTKYTATVTKLKNGFAVKLSTGANHWVNGGEGAMGGGSIGIWATVADAISKGCAHLSRKHWSIVAA